MAFLKDFTGEVLLRQWRHTSTRPGLLTLLKVAPAAAALLVPGASAFGEIFTSTAGQTFRVSEIVRGLMSPWSLAFLPGGDMLVTEPVGRLRVIHEGALQPQPVVGVPKAVARGQGGLLDVALHPGFAGNRLVYLSYSGAGQGGVNTEVMRARFDGGRLEEPDVIFRAAPKTSGSAHYGSRLLFAPDGTLFVTLGDRFSFRDEAQNTANHLGTVVRINDDGSVPKDNPFIGQDTSRPEIFSYGHRNSQGIAHRPGTAEIWQHEHGPRGGDEVNILKAGANFGWPKITYGMDYSGAIISDKTALPGMEQPVVYWVPSIAPSGMAFYDGDRLPKWKGDLFVGALAGAHLRRLRLDGARVAEQEELLSDLGERIRDVRSGPDGFIYVLTDSASNGRLLRLEPASD
jgi:glucose/arabinose dehydrogenase